MELDGYPVNTGDKLFDTDLRGVVTAAVVNDDAIICQAIQSGRKVTLTYNSAGQRVGHPHKVLFWQNPLIIIPAKDVPHWAAQVQTIQAVLRAMEVYSKATNPTTIDENLIDPSIASVMSAHERGLLNEDNLQALLNEIKTPAD